MKIMNNTDKLVKVALKKSLLKEYSNSQNDRIVYLKDGDEFQIQFFNPFSYTIAAEISLNNQKMSNKIVIRPGEYIWLERYLDSPRKFKFYVYEVNNSNPVREAIASNGDIEIKFYKERNNITYFASSISVNNFGNILDNWSDNKTTYSNNCQPSYSINSSGINIYTSSLADNTVPVEYSAASYTAKAANTIETGRVEKGNHSNQNFDYVDIDFEYYPFKTENIKLLPISHKPIRKNDLQKLYCTECGRKIKNKYKFCPYCGAKL